MKHIHLIFKTSFKLYENYYKIWITGAKKAENPFFSIFILIYEQTS